MKQIIKGNDDLNAVIFVLFILLLLALLSGCQKSSSIPTSFINAAIETKVEAGQPYLFLDRTIESVELDVSEPTYVILRIQVVDDIRMFGKNQNLKWVITVKFQEGNNFKVIKEKVNVNR